MSIIRIDGFWRQSALIEAEKYIRERGAAQPTCPYILQPDEPNFVSNSEYVSGFEVLYEKKGGGD